MNRLKTSDQGGFPLRLDDLRWMDNAYKEAFKGIMSSFGVIDQKVILLSGCERTVNNNMITISSGFISIAGEIYAVSEQTYNNPISSLEYWEVNVQYDAAGLKQFLDNTTHETYEIRTARIAVGPSVPQGSTEYSAMETIYDIINKNVDTVPVGAIIMWSGTAGSVPIGYSVCDGSNNTPDLRGRFVVGYDPRVQNPNNGVWDANYKTVGNTGGEKTHQLTVSEIPSHQHELNLATETDGVTEPGAVVIPNATEGNHDYDPPDVSGSVSSNGGNQPHNNLPPYYAIAYIMKTTTAVPNGALEDVSQDVVG